MTWMQGQFVPVRFKTIESELFYEWPPLAFKLYMLMRRYVWRSPDGYLGQYYSSGFLCVSAYFDQWAKKINVSISTISRAVKWMEDKGIVRCLQKAREIGGNKPNIYALGEIFQIGDDDLELFYCDYLKVEKKEEPLIVPEKLLSEVFEGIEKKIEIRPKEPFAPEQKVVQKGMQRLNKEPNREEVSRAKERGQPLVTHIVEEPDPEVDALIEELQYVNLDEEDEKTRPKWQIPENDSQRNMLAICGRKWFQSKEKTRTKALIAAFNAGDLLGKPEVYLKTIEALENIPELEGRRLPALPRSWLEYRAQHARNNHWSYGGFLDALYNRDQIVEHCRQSLKAYGIRDTTTEERRWIDD